MKKNLLLSLLNIVSLFGNAQTSKTIVNEWDCHYYTLFNLDFDRGKDLREFQGRLLIRNSKSYFYMSATEKTYEKEDTDNDITVMTDTLFKVIKDFDNNYVLFSDILFTKKETFYSDSLHQMDWELTTDKKYIDSLECFKAKTYFRGRHYIAWYTLGLAIPNGPWKIGGLPGLVIETYDENKNIYFLLKKFTRITNNSTADFPNVIHKQPYSTFIDNRYTFMKNVSANLSAQESGCLTCESKSKINFFFWEKVSRL